MQDLANVNGYINVVHHGFDMHLAVGILRVQDGLDYSNVIGKEEQIIIPNGNDEKKDDESIDDKEEEIVKTASNLVVEKTAAKKMSVGIYHGVDGNPLERKVVENITQFQVDLKDIFCRFYRILL